jgi:hypothetical protein
MRALIIYFPDMTDKSLQDLPRLDIVIPILLVDIVGFQPVPSTDPGPKVLLVGQAVTGSSPNRPTHSAIALRVNGAERPVRAIPFKNVLLSINYGWYLNYINFPKPG